MDIPSQTTMDLYSLLKVDRNVTEEEIHRSYKSLSSAFHPDKLPRSTLSEHREQIQQVFLEFKRANDILMDPVLRMAYDYYGEEGVALVRKVLDQQQNRRARQQASVDDGDDDDSDDDDEIELSLYHRVERLIKTNHLLQAREEMQKFMDQHDYHSQLTDENQVQLSCTMEFPPVIDLKATFLDGRDYLQNFQRAMAQKQAMAGRPLDQEEKQYFKQRIQEERGLVDYQINQIRDSQKAEVGFTLSSTPPRNVAMTAGGAPVAPKWSMAMGTSTNLVYPDVADVMTLAGKKKQEQDHPASMFVNMICQPVPDSQIQLTANLSNSQSHQFVLGTTRTFSNRTAFRYDMTYLTKSPLGTNIIMNIKSFRHIKDVGLISGGFSAGGNGQFLNWNAKWEAVQQQRNQNQHKYSVKLFVGSMQGNSLELSYRLRVQQKSWLQEYISIPRRLELSTVIGQFPKVTGMVTQEFTSLATHPTLGFGMEHDITLGCWTWIWEFAYNNSTFRVPIPVLHLGTVFDPARFYTQKVYYGIYCLLLQSIAADILQDDDTTSSEELPLQAEKIPTGSEKDARKTKKEAIRQLNMMEHVAEKKRYSETSRDGLVIIKATYWVEVRDGDMESRVAFMDATTQLQFWVTNGALSVPAIPKSSWLGFYDLETDSPSYRRHATKWWEWVKWRRWGRRTVHPEPVKPQPQLTIRYSHAEYVYEITISENEAVILPSKKAQLLGHSSSVR